VADGVLLAAVPLLAATLKPEPAAGVRSDRGAYLSWLLFTLASGAIVDRYDLPAPDPGQRRSSRRDGGPDRRGGH
jgi:hypothetical protein